MNKETFLKELALLINDVPKKEFDEIINYYQETIDDHLEEGMGEEEAIATLESVDTIAKQIHEETLPPHPSPAPVQKDSLAHGLRLALFLFLSPFIFTGVLLAMTWGLLMCCLLLIPFVCLISFGAISIVGTCMFPIFLFINIGKAFLLLGLSLCSIGASIYLKAASVWGYQKLQVHLSSLYNIVLSALQKGWANV